MFALRIRLFLLACTWFLQVGCREYSYPEKTNGAHGVEKIEPRNPNPISITPRPDVPSEDVPVYATDLLLNAGCMMNPEEMAVIAKHDPPSLCEHIVATPAQNADGDFFEVAAAISWTIEDESVISLECVNGPDDNSCAVHGLSDLFDVKNGKEPCTLVTACALNECPDPSPSDCMASVCSSATVCSVVNIEGGWSLDWPSFQNGSVASFAQYGRWFEDDPFDIDEGFVDGDSVSFTWGDYAFEGTLSADRATITGSATDLITFSSPTDWSATRL